jgi:hypothetical protein
MNVAILREDQIICFLLGFPPYEIIKVSLP